MTKVLKILLWFLTVMLTAVIGLECFCFLSPVRPISRPHLNRVLRMPEFTNTVRTNSLGMREEAEIPDQKKSNEKRIFLIGDSFMFGFGVERRDTLSVLLEKRLQNGSSPVSWRVINAAAAGTGPMHYAYCVRSIAIPLRADIVIVGLFIGNDLENTVSPYLVFPYSLKNWLKFLFPNTTLWISGHKHHRALTAPEQAKPMTPDPWNNEELYRWGKWEGISRAEMDRRRNALSPQARGWIEQGMAPPVGFYHALTHPQILGDTATLGSPGMRWGLQRSEKLLAQMHRDCVRANAKLILLLIPASYQVNDEQWEFLRTVGFTINPADLVQTKPQEEFIAFCRKEGIPCLDLLPALKKAPERPLFYQRDEHWRPTTVRYVASVLCDFLS